MPEGSKEGSKEEIKNGEYSSGQSPYPYHFI